MACDPYPFWDRIIADPAILVGKPVVQGTRISVERVLSHLSQNLDFADLFAAYPNPTVADVKAVLGYAHALVAGEEIYPVELESEHAAQRPT